MNVYQDYYFHKARSENYPARSVYKLKEIDKKYRILRPGMRVLDLGAAPGSWTLGASEKVGSRGFVLACDLKPAGAAFPANVRFLQGDILDPSADLLEELNGAGFFNVVLSDMAPATTGAKLTDQSRSLALAQAAFETACPRLCQGGSFVVKIFMGPDIQELLTPMRRLFQSVKTFKPKSSRQESKETFCIGLGFKETLIKAFPADLPARPPANREQGKSIFPVK